MRKKIRETGTPRVPVKLRNYFFLFYDSDISNIGEVPLRKNQKSQGFVAPFETIYDGVPIVAVLSVSGEDLQYRCFSKVNYVKVDAVFATNYHFQIIETGETYLFSLVITFTPRRILNLDLITLL
jgi:hypothetical protein